MVIYTISFKFYINPGIHILGFAPVLLIQKLIRRHENQWKKQFCVTTKVCLTVKPPLEAAMHLRTMS